MTRKKNTPAPGPQDDLSWPLVKAALEEAGTNLQRLARAHGVNNSLFTKVKYMPNARAEGIIAAALKRAPQDIWPSRYTADGIAVSPPEWLKRHKATTGIPSGNVQKRKVA